MEPFTSSAEPITPSKVHPLTETSEPPLTRRPTCDDDRSRSVMVMNRELSISKHARSQEGHPLKVLSLMRLPPELSWTLKVPLVNAQSETMKPPGPMIITPWVTWTRRIVTLFVARTPVLTLAYERLQSTINSEPACRSSNPQTV